MKGLKSKVQNKTEKRHSLLSGYTLLELILSMLMLSGLMLGSHALNIASLKLSNKTDDQTQMRYELTFALREMEITISQAKTVNMAQVSRDPPAPNTDTMRSTISVTLEDGTIVEYVHQYGIVNGQEVSLLTKQVDGGPLVTIATSQNAFGVPTILTVSAVLRDYCDGSDCGTGQDDDIIDGENDKAHMESCLGNFNDLFQAGGVCSEVLSNTGFVLSSGGKVVYLSLGIKKVYTDKTIMIPSLTRTIFIHAESE